MNVGKFKHKLIFQELEDDISIDFCDYKTKFIILGNVQFLKGRNFYDSLANNEHITATILIRKRTNVNSNMQVMYKNYIFNIESIIPDETERYLVLRVSQTIVDR